MLISSLFSGGSQQSQPKGAEKQKDKSETGNTEKNNAKAKDDQPAAQETLSLIHISEPTRPY